MKKSLLILIFIAVLTSGCTYSSEKYGAAMAANDVVTKRKLRANSSQYYLVQYKPLSKAKCMAKKDKLGLQYCPHDDDYLAGAALACGGLNSIPTGRELQKLAQEIYDITTEETSIYGERNDSKLKDMGIYAHDSHIYYWAGEEAKDGTGGYVRMFASKGSIPYYAPRDGSGYVSHQLGKVNYGETRYIVTANPEHNSNIVGLPNNDVLLTICKK